MKKFFVIPLILFCLMAGFTACRSTVAVRPAPLVVARPAAPAAGYVWIDGGWYRSRGNWVQRPGYWTSPRPNRVYVTGRWMQTPRGYYWKNGYWR